MGKLMYLFDFEFKRNFKAYASIIGSICLVFILKLIVNLNNYNYVINNAIRGKNSDTLTASVGTTSFDNLILDKDVIIFLIGLLICILYSIVIWSRDFKGKNKSICTLVMLPQERIKIYISKFLNILSFTYMYLISFIITLFLSYCIFPNFMKGDVINLGFVNETINKFGFYLPYSIHTFLSVYVFLMTSIIIVIFTLILINYYIKNNKIKFLIKCVMLIIFISILTKLIVVSNYYSIGFTITHSNDYSNLYISCIVIITICSLISKKILEKFDF